MHWRTYTLTHIHTYALMYIRTYASTHLRTYELTQVHTYTLTYSHYPLALTHSHLPTLTLTHLSTYTLTYPHTYTLTHLHSHTHTHTHALTHVLTHSHTHSHFHTLTHLHAVYDHDIFHASDDGRWRKSCPWYNDHHRIDQLPIWHDIYPNRHQRVELQVQMSNDDSTLMCYPDQTDKTSIRLHSRDIFDHHIRRYDGANTVSESW